MFIKKDITSNLYDDLALQLEVLLEDAQTLIGQLANTAALLNVYLEDINWVGFYLYHDNALHLGPFQGLPACTWIEIGKGVCGTAALNQKPLLVKDVHQFPGHIACDSASLSEIVIPIQIDGKLFGVLDIDSPILNRFSEEELQGLKKIVNLLEQKLIKK